jgi:hypothetical protein
MQFLINAFTGRVVSFSLAIGRTAIRTGFLLLVDNDDISPGFLGSLALKTILCSTSSLIVIFLLHVYMSLSFVCSVKNDLCILSIVR